jgi:hypothetical protein
MESVDERLFWEQLLQLIAEGHVVPIVGRDLLTVRYQDRDVLLYSFIAQRLAEYLGVSGGDLPEGDEINTVAYRYIEKGNRIEDIYSVLKIVMPPDKELSIPQPLSKLAAIRPFKLFVTTTFDSLLERAVNQERFAGQSKTRVFSYTPNAVEDLVGPVEQMDRPAVFHLFGKLSAIPAYAVTQEDTLEFLHSLQSESRQPHVLFDELNRNNLLILGCSFGDWLARFFIRTPKRQRLLEARGSTDYVADARMSGDNNLVLFLRHFSIRTKIFKGGGALDFIDELHRRWIARYPIEEPIATAGPENISAGGDLRPGAVFLSYASEDRPAVIKIRDALKAAGVDVVFDKDALHAGDDFEAKLKRSISECALFVPVISKHTLTKQRRFFRIEWDQALLEARKAVPTERFIVPVVIDDTHFDEPSVPEKFRNLHWEQAPDGEASSNFVSMVKQLYREYQKTVMGAV